MTSGARGPFGACSGDDPRTRRAGYDFTLDSHPFLFSAKTDDLGTTTKSSSPSSHHTASANSRDDWPSLALIVKEPYVKEPRLIVCQPSASKIMLTAEASQDPLMALSPFQ